MPDIVRSCDRYAQHTCPSRLAAEQRGATQSGNRRQRVHRQKADARTVDRRSPLESEPSRKITALQLAMKNSETFPASASIL